jgi:hypothetical protein
LQNNQKWGGAALAAAGVSAEAAGAGTGEPREKPGRQALVVLQDEDGLASGRTAIFHARLNTSNFHGGQRRRWPASIFPNVNKMPPLVCGAKGVNTAPHERPGL